MSNESVSAAVERSDWVTPILPSEYEEDVEDSALPSDVTQESSYKIAIVPARELDMSGLKPVRINTRLGYVNSRDGFLIVERHLDIARATPGVNVARIEWVEHSGAAMLYVERQISILDKEDSWPGRLKEIFRYRKVLLGLAQVGAASGLLPEKAVDTIAKGSGVIDAYEDVLALVVLFRKHEPVFYGHPLAPKALLAEAEPAALAMMNDVRPSSAPTKAKQKAADLAALNDDRVRLGTLLHLGYTELSRFAAFRTDLFPQGVPSLQSRKPLVKKKPANEPPTEV